jgi:hypothetical protein
VRRRPSLAFALALALFGGCLGGDHTFPDESDQVRSLHVNPYEATGGAAPRPAFVEVSGLGPDKQERAFAGHVRVTIEEALHPEANVEYRFLKAYDADVTAGDFSSPTVAFWKLTIPSSDLPDVASYRASATATIRGATFNASGLFDYSR